MKLIGVLSTAVLSLTLGVAAPAFAQEQQQEEKAKPAKQEEKAKPAEQEKQKAQPAAKQEEKGAQQQQKNTKQEEEKSAQQQQQKNTKQEEKGAQQQQQKNTKQEEEKNAQQQQQKNTKQEEKSAQQQHAQQEQRAGNKGGGRIPDDRFKAHFGREHSFRVSQGDYRNRRFRYGGYWFGFADPWPSNWLYTQDVYVIEINGVYYLCNPMYPGVNIALSFEL